MKINESVSPSVFKNLSIVVGLFIVFSVWQWVGGKIKELNYQPVYGESFASQEQLEKMDLEALPIVVAKSVAKSMNSAAINDLAIEAAFKAPEFVESVAPELKVTAAQRVFARYRPAISAVSNRAGAVVNGVYWRVGERIESMPISMDDGETVWPHLQSVTRNQAVLVVSGETLTLPFERF